MKETTDKKSEIKIYNSKKGFILNLFKVGGLGWNSSAVILNNKMFKLPLFAIACKLLHYVWDIPNIVDQWLEGVMFYLIVARY